MTCRQLDYHQKLNADDCANPSKISIAYNQRYLSRQVIERVNN